MKKYNLYLYLDYDSCLEATDNPADCLITDCLKCHENLFFITDCNNKCVAKSHNFDKFNLENFKLEEYEIEAFDEPDEKNFIEYLVLDSSNYRMIDIFNNIIIRYCDEDLEVVNNIIAKYGEEHVFLYATNDPEDIKSTIKNLRIHRNASIVLSGGFVLSTVLSFRSLIKHPSIVPVILVGTSIKCLGDNLKNVRQDNIDIKVNKKLLKKLG